MGPCTWVARRSLVVRAQGRLNFMPKTVTLGVTQSVLEAAFMAYHLGAAAKRHPEGTTTPQFAADDRTTLSLAIGLGC